jgi:hypothetical protein
MFQSPRQKLTIASVDEPNLQVTAQYNPAELQLERQIPWGRHNARDNRSWWKREPTPEHDLEFTGAEGRTMSLELLFDGYETKRSVEPRVQNLEALAEVTDPASAIEALRRPHLCLLTWGPGDVGPGMAPFRCVVESLTVKYTMFDGDGTPLRAVCNLKLKESFSLSVNIVDPSATAAAADATSAAVARGVRPLGPRKT